MSIIRPIKRNIVRSLLSDIRGNEDNGLLAGLEFYLSMDEASGNRVDRTGNYTGADNGSVGSRVGVKSLAADFETNYLLLSNVTISVPFTISAWINPDTLADDGTIFRTAANGVLFEVQTPDIIRIGVNDGAWTLLQTLGVVSTGSWQHAVFIADGSFIKLYINGVLKRKTADTRSPSITSNVGIGRHPSAASDYFDGGIDEEGYWRVALTDGDIAVGEQAKGQVGQLYDGILGYDNFN